MKFSIVIENCAKRSEVAFRPAAIDLLMEAMESLGCHYYWTLQEPNKLRVDTERQVTLARNLK
jgi:hypothetical protein